MNLKTIPVNNLQDACKDFGCEEPPKDLNVGTDNVLHWGKNSEGKNNNSISGFYVNNKKELLTLTKFTSSGEQRSQNYLLKNVQFQKPNLTFKEPTQNQEIKDISKEFHKFNNCTNHAYLTDKQIKIPDTVTLKRDQRKSLIIPFFNIKNNVLSGWQQVFKRNNKWVKYTRKDSSNKDVYLPIGAITDICFIAEGFSTACSVHSITGQHTICCFGKNNLNSTIEWVLKNKRFQKIVVASDNDKKPDNNIDNSFIPSIKDNRLILLRPTEPGQDFNDCQFNEEEITKLKTLTPAIDYKTPDPDDDPKTVKEYLKALKQQLKMQRIKDQILKPDFLDDEQIIPTNNLFLLSGSTESGKTAFTLKFLEKYLTKKKIIIVEHDETNRENRLNKWLSEHNITEQSNNFPVIEENRILCLRELEPGCILFIDDCDSFMQIQNTIDRRQVADALGLLSWIAQLMECTIIACHYTTKSSKLEKDVQSRSGGSQTWINKVRYAWIIEKGPTGEADACVNQTKDTQIEEVIHSYISWQKGNRDNTKTKSYWLKDDFSIGEPIYKKEREEIMAEKLNPKAQESIQEIADWLQEGLSQNKEITTKAFYKFCENNFNMKQKTAERQLRKLKQYTTERKGSFEDRKHYIVRAADQAS